MTAEEYYLNSTRGYLEFLDIMIGVARTDGVTTVQELTFLLTHREFTADTLEGIYENMKGK